jgi:hypothetical protein
VHTLLSARAAWAAAQKSSYTIDQAWSCECRQTLYGNVRITVQNDQIANVVSLKDGQPVPPADWNWY